MVLHIGNNRSVPMRDIVAVLDVQTLRRARDKFAPGDCENGHEPTRSIVVLESDGLTSALASPISAAALRLRSQY